MKTYKTWEVVKMLSENPRLKFRLHPACKIDYFVYVDKTGEIVRDKSFSAELRINDKWELIQQPVTFMEAIKAYREGKIITCKYGEGGQSIYKNKSIALDTLVIRDQNDNGVSPKEILEGKWYIQEEAPNE